VVLRLPEYSSGASAQDQHGHSDPSTMATRPSISSGALGQLVERLGDGHAVLCNDAQSRYLAHDGPSLEWVDLEVAQLLPHGRRQAWDRHLKSNKIWDNLRITSPTPVA
jgi:hypothetical protein